MERIKVRCVIKKNDGTSVVLKSKYNEKLEDLITDYLKNDDLVRYIVIEVKEYNRYGLLLKSTKEYFYEW